MACHRHRHRRQQDCAACSYGADLWAGHGGLWFFPSEIEEHVPLAPIEVLGAYRFSSGYTFTGAEVLHRWV
jgi:hypothetical protein